MKQQTRKIYWLLPISIIMLFLLAGCVRPAPQPDATPTPASLPATVEMPTAVPATPITAPDAYPDTGGTEPTAEAVNPDDGGEVVEMPTAVPPEQTTTHTVQEGDTLTTISQQYGVSPEALAAANNITPSGELTAGQTLVIPSADTVTTPPEQPSTEQPATGERVHVVQPGENLFRISLRYGKTVNEVAAYNGIANPNFIYPGQVIRIP